MKSTFELTLFDDEKNKEKLENMGTLEVMLDDINNKLPDSYYYFADDLPLGTKIRVTFEEI